MYRRKELVNRNETTIIKLQRVIFNIPLLILLIPVLLTSSPVAAFEEDEKIISGAGAHFVWTIFDELKHDLEKTVNREIILFGKNSMLGQGCNAGIKTAVKNRPGNETFGFVCCQLSKKEIREKDLIVYPLALEPVVILLHKNNPITNLSKHQISSIFSGKISNWKQVGGPDKAIVLVTRLHCKKRPGHWKRILPDKKLFSKIRLNVSSSAEMTQRLSDFPWAIGHTGSTWAKDPELNIKQITIDNIQATAANLKQKKYPFFRALSAVTNKTPSEDVLKIIRKVQTGKAFRKVARKYELLPTNEPAL